MALRLMILFGFIGFGWAVDGELAMAILFSAAAICSAIVHGASLIADGLRANVVVQAQLRAADREREISKEIHEHRASRGEST